MQKNINSKLLQFADTKASFSTAIIKAIVFVSDRFLYTLHTRTHTIVGVGSAIACCSRFAIFVCSSYLPSCLISWNVVANRCRRSGSNNTNKHNCNKTIITSTRHTHFRRILLLAQANATKPPNHRMAEGEELKIQ